MKYRIITLLLAGALAATASAQLSLDWWTANGGAGTSVSADGRFTLNGTAGQPDAGTLTGDGFVLAGGFWNASLFVPRIQIRLLSDGHIALSWPAWAQDYVLEQNSTVTGATDWDEVPDGYETDGCQIYVTLPASSDMQFYRLRQVCLEP